MVQGEQKDHRASDEEHLDDPKNIVPDSQPVMRKDRRLLPGLLSSVSRVKSAVSRKRYAVSEGVSTVLNRQERTSSTVDVLNQGQSEQPVLSSAQRSRANDKVLQEQVTEKLEKFLKEKIQRARSPEGTGALGQEEKPAQRGTRRRGKTAQPQEAKEHLSTEIPNRPAPASPAKPLNRTLPVSDNSPYTFGKDYSFCREVCPQKVQGRPMAAPNSEAQQRTLPVAKGPVEKMMRTISRKYTAQRGPSLDTCAQNR
ncbi:uncharacterized protein LOC136748834 [Amia ocellicauda]|uniref:uncharacterized protein LOC136748834 n=1 Tax=Amia ocellicauda TaxID=2972642 RepID=UPI003463E1AB